MIPQHITTPLISFVLAFFMCVNPVNASAQDNSNQNKDEGNDLLDVDVQYNAQVTFAYKEQGNGFISEIQAYRFIYPKSNYPSDISYWSIRKDLEIIERSVGFPPRGPHNPLRVRFPAKVVLNNKTFYRFPWRARNKHIMEFAYTNNSRVSLIRAVVTSDDATKANQELQKLITLVPCLCKDKC